MPGSAGDISNELRHARAGGVDERPEPRYSVIASFSLHRRKREAMLAQPIRSRLNYLTFS